MNEYRRVIKNIFSLLGVQSVNYLFPLFSVAVVSRALGVENLGVLLMAQAISMYVQQATDFGFNLTATRQVALYSNDQGKLNEIYTATTLAKATTFIASNIVLLIAGYLFYGISKLLDLVFVLNLGVLISVLYPVWLFHGLQEMKNILFANFISKSSSLLLMYMIVETPEDVYLAAFIQSSSWFFVALYSLLIINNKRYCSFCKVGFSQVYYYLKESSFIYLSVLSTSFYTTFNMILLGNLISPSAAAVYGIADKLRIAVQSLVGVFAQALYPYFCTKVEDDRYSLWFFVGLGFSAGLCMYIFSPIAVSLLAGKEFEKSIELAQVFSLLCPIVSVAAYYANLKISAKGYYSIYLKVYFAGALFHLSYVWFSIDSFGSFGVAVSVIITELFITGLLVFGYKKVSKQNEV